MRYETYDAVATAAAAAEAAAAKGHVPFVQMYRYDDEIVGHAANAFAAEKAADVLAFLSEEGISQGHFVAHELYVNHPKFGWVCPCDFRGEDRENMMRYVKTVVLAYCRSKAARAAA